jgi:transcription factor SPN1
MDEYDDLKDDMPPPDAMGDDGPLDNEDKLDDTNEEFAEPPPADDSDDESLLSEVDEAQFADFDPTAVQVAPDLEALKAIKAKRRDRTGEETVKKKKEKTRERVRRNRDDSDDGFQLDGEVDGKRSRKSRPGEGGERRKAVSRVEVDESTLTPAERRKRALDRAMDAAVKKTKTVRRKKGGDIVRLSIYYYATTNTIRTSNRWPTKRSKICANA